MVERTRRFVMQHPNCFDRTLFTGHVTGSSWVVNPARTHVLMMLHRKLNRWLQLGGHADGESDIVQVVLKETAEESGVDIHAFTLVRNEIFDVDVHIVHANQHDPRHEHFDIRFLLELDDSIPLPGNDESHQIGWAALEQVPRLNNARSLYRMVQKTRRLEY